MYFKRERGNLGEEIASQYLQKQNYKIIDRNFYGRRGEIDIIAKEIEKQEIVFIEVKTRTSNYYGKPRDAIDENKMKHIYDTARYYIYLKGLEKEYIRFDVIEVYMDKEKNAFKINHIKNIE